MTWHLFYIEAETNPDPCDSTVRAWIVSAESDSQAKAEELARAAVDDQLPTPSVDVRAVIRAAYDDMDADEPAVTSCTYLGVIDRDVFQPIGELAQ